MINHQMKHKKNYIINQMKYLKLMFHKKNQIHKRKDYIQNQVFFTFFAFFFFFFFFGKIVFCFAKLDEISSGTPQNKDKFEEVTDRLVDTLEYNDHIQNRKEEKIKKTVDVMIENIDKKEQKDTKIQKLKKIQKIEKIEKKN